MVISPSETLRIVVDNIESVLPEGLRADPNMSFIEMGFDSLLLASLELRLQRQFDIRSGFLLNHKSPKECAEKLSSVKRRIADKEEQSPKCEKHSVYPLSQAQRRLIFSVSRNNPFEKLEVKVPNLDIRRFIEAWSLISKRHSILRTSLSLTGQRILDEPPGFEVLDTEDALERPLRLELNDEIIHLTYHHALFDGPSINLLMSELLAAYDSPESASKIPVPPQYFEYCLFEEQALKTLNLQECIEYWVNELKDYDETQLLEYSLSSPTENFPSSSSSSSSPSSSSSIERTLDENTSRELSLFASKNQLTLFNLMNGIIRILFYKLYDADDLLIGFPVEHRRHQNFENTIGLFMNTNICRVKLDSELSSVEFLTEVAQKMIKSMSNGHIPFNKLVNHLQSRGIVESEDKLLNLIVVDDKQISVPRSIQVKTVDHSMQYPQVWYIQNQIGKDSIKLRVEFDAKMFSEECIHDEIRWFESLCRKLLDDPSRPIKQISLIEEKTIDVNILDDFLHVILSKLSSLSPEKIVLVFKKHKISTVQFLDQVWNAAENLKNIVNGGDLKNIVNEEKIYIALILPRSPEFIFALFAAWLNGYIAIPLNYQKEIPLQLLPSNTLLITNTDQILHSALNTIQVHKLLEKSPKQSTRKLFDFHPNYLAYCTFTSGSTGLPKLVMSERIGLSNLLFNYTKEFGYDEESVSYQVVNPAFDIFLADVVASFGNGSTLILAKHQIPSISEICKC